MRVRKGILEDGIYTVLLERGKMKASELEEEVLGKTGAERSTFYRTLAKLVGKGIVLKDRVTWKNSVYQLNPQAIPLEKLEIPELIMEVTGRINEEAKKWKTEEELLEGFGSWLRALCLYVVLQKVKSQKPFDEIVRYYLDSVTAIITNYIMLRETPAIVFEPDIKKWIKEKFGRHTRGLGQYPEYREALKRFDKNLEKLYPEQIKAFEQIFQKVTDKKED